MLSALYHLVRPALFRMGPEEAHELSLKALEAGTHPRDPGPDAPEIGVDLWGLRFPNPVGIAAGYDKDARVPDAILAMGCGFAECGTLTPRPQEGNPRPRVFRLIAERAMINRLGFNNGGHDAALARLARRPRRGIVGVNIGANKEAADRAGDYVLGLERFSGVASYLTINISSPNTPGLRDLQAPAALDELLGRVMAARAGLVAAGRPKVPVVVKIAPDIAEEDLPAIAARLAAHAADAIAVSNTTLDRAGVGDPLLRAEAGGLSGAPLFHRSTVVLARVHELTQGRIPLIGIGGITSEETALAKIEAGATLLQLYTGLVYEGPGLIGRIKRTLAQAAKAAGGSLAGLRGRKAAEWARRPLSG
jgi:dihydroorotate dehydrogenase